MPNRDIKKRRTACTRWYYKNHEKARELQRKYKAEKRNWFKAYKATLKCKRCKENHPSCLDFHHPGQKDKTINLMLKNNNSKEKIMKEISKCVVLCSNCHRKLHHNARKSEKNDSI